MESRGELLYHRSKKKATKNVLSARFNLKNAIKTHSTKYLSSTLYELITKVYLEKKKRKKESKKENGKEKKNKNCAIASNVCSWTRRRSL